MRRFLLLAAAVALVALASRAGDDDERVGPDRSLVFGYIAMDAAPVKLKWLDFRIYAPVYEKHKNFFPAATHKEGLFFHCALPPGSYQVTGFGGSSVARGILLNEAGQDYRLGELGRNQTAFKILHPGLHFLGAWEFKKGDRGGFFRRATFGFVPAKKPPEHDVLVRLDEALGDHRLKDCAAAWGAKVKARLAGGKS